MSSSIEEKSSTDSFIVSKKERCETLIFDTESVYPLTVRTPQHWLVNPFENTQPVKRYRCSSYFELKEYSCIKHISDKHEKITVRYGISGLFQEVTTFRNSKT